MSEIAKCDLCGEPMPEGEEMFKIHGYSGNCPKPPLPRLVSGAELIALERRRQIEVEGWTAEHDSQHSQGNLLAAAICYCNVAHREYESNRLYMNKPAGWPWDVKWWRPSDDPIRNLVKAGALIAAEIDRLQRKS